MSEVCSRKCINCVLLALGPIKFDFQFRVHQSHSHAFLLCVVSFDRTQSSRDGLSHCTYAVSRGVVVWGAGVATWRGHAAVRFKLRGIDMVNRDREIDRLIIFAMGNACILKKPRLTRSSKACRNLGAIMVRVWKRATGTVWCHQRVTRPCDLLRTTRCLLICHT